MILSARASNSTATSRSKRLLAGSRIVAASWLLLCVVVWVFTLRQERDARGLLVVLAIGGLVCGAAAGAIAAVLWDVCDRLASRRGLRMPRLGSFCASVGVVGFAALWASLAVLLGLEGGGASGVVLGLSVAAGIALAAAGISLALARGCDAVAQSPPRCSFPGNLRLPGPLTVSLVAVSALLVLSRSDISPRPDHKVAFPRPASGHTLPNIILISLDTLRPDHLSTNGYRRPTSPFIDRLVGEGTLFEQTISSSSWTIPAHATLFTGLSPSRIGSEMMAPAESGSLRLPDGALTMAEILRGQGYITAGFIAAPPMGAGYGFDQGFDHFDDRLPPSLTASITQFFPARAILDLMDIQPALALRRFEAPFVGLCNLLEGQGHLPPTEDFLRHRRDQRRFHNAAPEINGKVGRFLAQERAAPFFLYVHYFDVHDPYSAPPPAFGRWGNDGSGLGFIASNNLLFDVMKGRRVLTTQEKDLLIGMYDEEIVTLDSGVQALMEMLQRERLLDDSIVVLYSDHGESFGEHGNLFHGHSLGEELIRILFAVRAPGRVPAGLRIPATVRSVDILPTVLDLAGLDPGLAGKIEGVSLAARLRGEAADSGEEEAFSEVFAGGMAHPHFGPFQMDHRSIRSRNWKFVWSGDGSRRLYDLSSDPGEDHDLSEQHVGIARALEGRLADWAREGHKKPDDTRSADREKIEALKSLGYVSQSP